MRFLRDKLRDKLFEDGTSCPERNVLRDKWPSKYKDYSNRAEKRHIGTYIPCIYIYM